MEIENISNIIKPIIIFVIILIIYLFVRIFLKKSLISKAKTKKMKHNITIFLNFVTYLFIFISAIIILLYFTGGNLALGIGAGLLTAALGWALQRPITGIAAWIMVIASRPFSIGDRIIVGTTKGDVMNITLTHIFLKEFGGTTGGEETSGRIIMIPNSVLFEKDVINYTFQDDYILDEITVTVTYESDIDEAEKICLDVAKKLTKDLEKIPSSPFVRSSFHPSGIDLKIRYYVSANKRQLYNSEITKQIFKEIGKEKSVEIAYPHTEVIFRKKK